MGMNKKSLDLFGLILSVLWFFEVLNIYWNVFLRFIMNLLIYFGWNGKTVITWSEAKTAPCKWLTWRAAIGSGKQKHKSKMASARKWIKEHFFRKFEGSSSVLHVLRSGFRFRTNLNENKQTIHRWNRRDLRNTNMQAISSRN